MWCLSLHKSQYVRRSPVWQEYIPILPAQSKDGKLRANCKHCKNTNLIAESRYGTTNVKNHLEKCKAYQRTLSPKGKSVFNQNTYRELVAKAIIKHGYPFSWVEHEGNRDIHEFLCDDVKTICRNTAKADCLKLYLSLKDQLKDTLSNLPGRICLTSDLWTSCQTEGYLCLTAHFVDANWKLTSLVLNFCHMEHHSGKEIYILLLKLIREWGIENKVFSLTLDNASSNDKAQDYLKATLNGCGCLLNEGKFFHVRCVAHVLNLVVKDGLKVINHAVVKIRESVKHVKASEGKKIHFRSAVELVGLKETKALWLDVPTRWNSTYLMLDRALIYRDAFNKLNLVDKAYIYCPDNFEWEMVEKIRDVLGPFNDITELFSGSDYPTANLYFENVWRIAMLLKELVRVQSHDEVLRKMAMDMQKKFDKYWADSDEDNYGTLFGFAMVLDPRCKLHFLKYCYKKLFDDEMKARAKVHDIQYKMEMLLREYKNYNTSTSSSPSSDAENNAEIGARSQTLKRKFTFCEDYDRNEVDTSCEKSKLSIYLEDDRVDRRTNLDILEYWKQNEGRYGELAHMAREILSVPLTTVASESTFSIGGRLLNKWRTSYIPENVEALITTCSWLYGYRPIEEDEFFGSDVDWTTFQEASS
ncbi:hypothetical protein RND81_07G067300 [Saponaria officinalis]|uniref:Transposase n=1 Tax=Saponaria officinalis TaxID=3572 RepID=A0AAW1JN99_SAPOF